MTTVVVGLNSPLTKYCTRWGVDPSYQNELVRPSRKLGATSNSNLFAVMPVKDCPPFACHLGERRVSGRLLAALGPWLVRTNEVNHADGRLEMLVSRNVLVVRRRRDVVAEADAIEGVLEVHVQEALISTVERDSPLGQGYQCIIVAHIGRQGHDTGVEQIGPANIGSSGEGVGKIEELVGGAVGNDIGIDIDDLAELGQLPKVDLGEGRVEIGPVHQEEVRWVLVFDSLDGDHVVVDGL